MSEDYRALYLHIPFCASRCGYCDFVTEALEADDERISSYTEELIRVLRRSSRSGELGSVKTVYVGGGTPTHIGSRRLISLVYTVGLSLNLHTDSEFTVEANPESLTAPLARDLFSLGVNRFSLGVQSLNDDDLLVLGRGHNSDAARRAIATAGERCNNVSVDLICGIPKQTLSGWQATLREVVASGVKHISVYPLTLEATTPLARDIAAGRLVLPDDDSQAELLLATADLLAAEGFERYEVASWARPGYACAHNIAYWTGQSYLGLGRGAAGMRNTASGRQRYQDGELVESLSLRQRLAEDLMLAMRLARGIAVSEVQAAEESLAGIAAVFSTLLADGLVELCEGRYCPTQRGWLLGNQIFGRIWALA
ncbi:MAG: radical SAM family heme chaperone HemW [Coriobacteriales bacterium]|jgi:oxygen-independent coproporphyrinogen-3 oxidase|nr:radical SAM family heme chaperone HemW [Coriobacteriales bacterium]